MDEPLNLARFGLADLRIAKITVNEVQANWKIVIENYNECLHCPTIHPELVAVVPAYKKGSIFESGRADGGVSLADGRTAVADDPRLRLPLLPGFDDRTTTRGPTTARWSTPRCSSTSTGPAAWPPRCSRPGRRAAGW